MEINNKERLNKHIASLGICSRRKADELISAGRVKVNGVKVTDLATRVDPNSDVVDVVGFDTKFLQEELVYIALNKPTDYICTNTDKQGTSVLELLTEENYEGRNKRKLLQRVYPVGRLDKESEGLVILTNDGELTNKISHPTFAHEKEYEITLNKRLMPDVYHVLTTKMDIGEGEIVNGIEIVDMSQRGKQYVITVILREGKNRQLRKMFGRVGYRILALKRTRIGKLKIGTIPIGQWKFVSKEKIM